MAASQDQCIAQFPRQQVCTDRNYARLAAWAAYITALPLPPSGTAPEKAWVQQRVVAERMPLNGFGVATAIAGYLTATPNIANKIRDHLNAWNSEATETTLAADIDGVLATVMPVYCGDIVFDQDVANWCDQNGYPRPPGLVNVTPPPA